MLETGLIAFRFLHFAAVLSLFGAALFPLYTFRGRLQSLTEKDIALLVSLRRFLAAAAVLALFSGLGWFVFTAGAMAGDIAQAVNANVLSTTMQATDFGPLWAVRLVLTSALAVLLIRWPFKPALWLVPLLAALLLASLAGTGHARVTDGWSGALHIAADGTHLLAAGLWIGGLWPLGIIAATAQRNVDESDDALAIGEALRRFSGVGTIAVAILVAAGLVNSWFLVGTLDALTSTAYGWLLTAKVALFLLMVMLATANRFWITPQLSAARSASVAGWLSRLRRHLLAEQALALCVLALVSVLGTLQPAIPV